MPVVPVKKATVPGRAVAAPQKATRVALGGDTARRKMQIAESIGQSTGQLTGTLMDAKNRADQLRVDGAINNRRRKASELRSEYEELVGEAAINARGEAEDESLPQHFGNRLTAYGDYDTMSLTSDQKVMYQQQSPSVDLPFLNGAEQHASRQFVQYSMDTTKASIALGLEAVPANYDSEPEVLDTVMDGVRKSTLELARLNGVSAEQAQEMLDATNSAMVSSVITTAIGKKDPTRASAFLKLHGDKLNASDTLKMNRLVTTYVEGVRAREINDINVKKYSSAVLQDLSAKVNRLASAGGDVFELPQDMTGLNTVEQVAMATILGREATDELIAKAEADGKKAIHYAPKEDVARIMDVVMRFNKGEGYIEMPTQAEVVKSAMDLLPPDASPELRKMTQDGAVQSWKTMDTTKKQLDERALQAVFKKLFDNGGDLNSVTAQEKMDLVGRNAKLWGQAIDYSKKLLGVEKAKSNDLLYNTWIEKPDLMARLSTAEFTMLAEDNIPDPKVRRYLAGIRANLITGTGAESVDSLSSNADKLIKTALRGMGVDPLDKSRSNMKKVARIDQTVRAILHTDQEDSGKKFLPEGLEKRIKEIFALELPSTAGWSDVSREFTEISVGDIPDKARMTIDAAFRIKGRVPTEAQTLDAYRRWRAQNKLTVR